jgi:hypothetical protein
MVTSALAGDPDPYPQVSKATKGKLRSVAKVWEQLSGAAS